MKLMSSIRYVALVIVFCGGSVQGEFALEPVACTLEHMGHVDTLDELQSGMALNLFEVNGAGSSGLPLECDPWFHAGPLARRCVPPWSAAEACLRLDWTKAWIDGLTGWTEGVEIGGPCPIEGGWREAFRIVERPVGASTAK